MRWVVIGVFVLSSALNYLDRLTLTSLAPLLKTEFELSNTDFGYILFAFNVAYAVAAPAAGWFVDRAGLNIGVTLAVAFWSLANIATGAVSSLRGFIVCRTWLGVAESAGVPAAGKAIGTYLPPPERALGHAVSQIGISVGGMAAPLCAIAIATRFGWRWAFVVTGSLGFVWIPLWLWASRLAPRAEEPATAVSASGRSLLGDSRMWACVGATALGMTPYALWFNWITVYLTQAHGLTLAQAAVPASIPPLVGNVGGLVGGWLSFRLIAAGRSPAAARRMACVLSSACLLLTALVPLTQQVYAATGLIAWSLFWAASFSVNIYTLPLDLFGRSRAAFAVSLLTAAYGIVAGVLSPLIGHTIDRYGFFPACIAAGVLPLLGTSLLATIHPRHPDEL
jgi:ACS family hexuronate transporter-like MFS transporter